MQFKKFSMLILTSVLFSTPTICLANLETDTDLDAEQIYKIRQDILSHPVPRSATIFTVKKLEDATWTNGFDFLTMEKVSPDYYIGSGGTPHEGGLEMKLKIIGDNQYLNESEYTISSGAKGSLNSVKTEDGTQYYLLFRDNENKPVEIYTTINQLTPLENGTIMDDPIFWLYRIQQQNSFDILQGKYIDEKKKNYKFENSKTGFEVQMEGAVENTALEIGVYDLLSRTFKYGNFCYKYDITETGLTLTKYTNCNSANLDDEDSIETRELTYSNSNTPRFDCLSKRVYPASFFTGLSSNVLKIMRNEIFAKHGHKFKNKKLASHFESQSWYQPSDTETKLTEIENINILSIQIAEQYYNQFD